MKKLFRHLKAYQKECILGPLFKLLEALFELLVPLVVASIIDKGILQNSTSTIFRMCFLLIVFAMTGLLCSVTAQYFAAKAAIGFSTKIRHVLMEHIQTLSYQEIDKIGPSTLITRLNSDINQVQSGVNLGLRLLLRSPFVVFGAMIMAFTIDTRCAMVFVLLIAVLLVIVFGIMLITMPMYKNVQGRLDKLTETTRENLNGVRVIRAFCMEDRETEKFNWINSALTAIQISVGRISAAMNPVTYLVVNGAILLLIYRGALQVQSGVLTQGQVVALYNYMGQILVELVKMANLIIQLTRAAACGNRIQSVLEVQPSQKFGDTVPSENAPRGCVVFDHVSMSYGDSGENSLEDISFSADPGDIIGIIGGTGSGKTTLVNLIARFYDPSSGHISVDGQDILMYSKEELRKRIGIVPQKAVLFKGNIRSNLLWGNENASETDMMEALETAQASEIVKGRPEGLDAAVEQSGHNFSGGQRQRLTIARALIKKPEILIMDDSSSALDYATDARLRSAVRQMKNAPTTFIVSQRASSVRFANKILVLEDGKQAGLGTHEDLLKTCAVYREIYESQFGKEEADKA